MDVLDNNILSIFAKVDQLPVLFLLLGEPLLISPNVHRELQEGITAGYAVLQPLLDLVASGRLRVLSLSAEEASQLDRLDHPDKGETDSLVYCLSRRAAFVTNDERAARLGERMGVVCLRLKDVLRRLWKDKCLTQDQVRVLVQLLETQAGMVVTRQDEIFRD